MAPWLKIGHLKGENKWKSSGSLGSNELEISKDSKLLQGTNYVGPGQNIFSLKTCYLNVGKKPRNTLWIQTKTSKEFYFRNKITILQIICWIPIQIFITMLEVSLGHLWFVNGVTETRRFPDDGGKNSCRRARSLLGVFLGVKETIVG